MIRNLCVMVLAAGLAAEVYAQQTNDPAALMGRAIEIRTEANLKAIQNAIGNYHAMNDRYPASLEELVKAGLLESLPEGNFLYDPNTGAVSSAAGSPPPAATLPEATPENAMAMALDVQAKANLKKIKVALNVYTMEHDGQFPEKLEDLVKQGLLERLPTPPTGAKYFYDPKTGKVDYVKK